VERCAGWNFNEDNPGQRPGLNINVVCGAYPTMLKYRITNEKMDSSWSLSRTTMRGWNDSVEL